MKYSVGTDPEGFAIDKNGVYRSVVGLLGGTKVNPRRTKNGYVQEDNVAWEVNTLPATSADMFVNHVLSVLGDVSQLLTPLDLSIDLSPIALFPSEELQTEEARKAGCTVDFNAWTMEPNSPPNLSMTNMRSAGGHLHIAWDKLDNMLQKVNFVRAMDQVAGIPSILMDPNTERRKLYGKAGCFRVKDVIMGDPFNGVEYRTLSNFWLKHTDTIRWAYNTVEQAINRFDELTGVAEIHGDWIVHIINNSDVKEAKVFCDMFNIAVA